MSRSVLLVFLVLVLSACSRIPERADVIGFYVLDKPNTPYKLELRSDGTYVHSFVGNDGIVITKLGSWVWDVAEADNEIALNGFEEFPGENMDAAKPTTYLTSPTSSWGALKLRAGGDPDAPEHWFVKQRQE